MNAAKQPPRHVDGKHDFRPLVSFFLISYNQEQFIEEAMEGAFAQTYQPLEIICSDDCSTDRTFDLMRKVARGYKGPHEVRLNRNEQNLGLCGNVNRLLDLTAGEIIVIAGGDDISLPGRVERSWQILTHNPRANCVSFQLQTIDRIGAVIKNSKVAGDWVKKYSLSDFVSQNGFHLNGPSRAFKRQVCEFFGPLSADAQTEDSTTLLRCLLLGEACLSGVVGVKYRIHGDNYYASDKKRSISYSHIFDQYTRDIGVALKQQIISSDLSDRLEAVLLNRIKTKFL
jgi:glycosyltransferase involved in cell wall biosynthesis